MSKTHWCLNFSNFSKNKDFIRYGTFQNDLVLDLWPWPPILLSVLLLFDETNTLVAEVFKSVQKQRFYRVCSILTSQGQTGWPWKNDCYLRNQRAKGNLHADFERNHYSNLNHNIFLLSDLDLDLWHSAFFCECATTFCCTKRTGARIFFYFLQKCRFYRVQKISKWPWPWPVTLTSDCIECATTSRWRRTHWWPKFSNR